MKIIVGLLVSISVLLTGCGGGGGGESNSATIYTGQYIDAPVRGLSFTASPSGLTGTTDINGNFRFQSGDTISFNIVTPGGTIGVGSVSPVSPSSSSITVPVSVVSLPNGVQIAQILQTLGGTGQLIDVSNTNQNVAAINNANSVATLNNFIATTGTTSVSSILPNLINPSVALSNAMNSIERISSSLSGSLIDLFSRKNYYYYASITGPISSFSGGSFMGVDNNTTTSISGSQGVLAVTGERTATVTYGSQINLMSLRFLDGNEGLYNQSYTLSGASYAGNGIYKRILKSSEGGLSSGISLANNTFKVGGLNVLCSPQTAQFKLSFNSVGTGFSAYCGTALLTSGTVVNNSSISGLVILNSSLFGSVSVGLAYDAVLDSVTRRVISGTIALSQIGGGGSKASGGVAGVSSADLDLLLPAGPRLYVIRNCNDFSCSQ